MPESPGHLAVEVRCNLTGVFLCVCDMFGLSVPESPGHLAVEVRCNLTGVFLCV